MRSLKKYWITMGVGLFMVLAYAWSKGLFQLSYVLQVLLVLCDAFFVAGSVLIAAGLMVFITNEGTFDLFTYGVKSVADVFRKVPVKKYSSYYDYRTARAAKKYPFAYLLICGAVFLVISIVLYCCCNAYL